MLSVLGVAESVQPWEEAWRRLWNLFIDAVMFQPQWEAANDACLHQQWHRRGRLLRRRESRCGANIGSETIASLKPAKPFLCNDTIAKTCGDHIGRDGCPDTCPVSFIWTVIWISGPEYTPCMHVQTLLYPSAPGCLQYYLQAAEDWWKCGKEGMDHKEDGNEKTALGPCCLDR